MIAAPAARRILPKATDRLRLGRSGLLVSPICIGLTRDPDTILAAFDAGVNFFFLTGDLHWPIYDATREGLQRLLARGPQIRDQIVVTATSYLDMPLFGALQFHEIIQSVTGLERIDVLVAGAISEGQQLYPRLNAIEQARSAQYLGARATGATFHSRPHALAAANQNLLDVQFIRYNARHPGANRDLFPYLRMDRIGLNYCFKSTMFAHSEESLQRMAGGNLPWRPHLTDHYRFVLSQPALNGILCSPFSPGEMEGLLRSLEKGGLTPEEEYYMTWLSTQPRG